MAARLAMAAMLQTALGADAAQPAGAPAVQLTPLPMREQGPSPYRRARLVLDRSDIPAGAGAVLIRSSLGGPGMTYEWPPAADRTVSLGMYLPALWPRQQYELEFLAGLDPWAPRLGHTQARIDWPVQAVDEAAFLAPSLYRRWGQFPADWPSRYRAGLLGAAVVYGVLLGALLAVRSAAWRRAGLAGAMLAGLALAWVALRAEPTYIARELPAPSPAWAPTTSPAATQKTPALLLAARRTQEVFLPGELWAPLCADGRTLQTDSSVVAPGRGAWVHIEPGRPQMFVRIR